VGATLSVKPERWGRESCVMLLLTIELLEKSY